MNLDKLEDNNVLSKIKKTFKENKLYNPTLNKFKIKLWNKFLKNGIPNKKNEEYKYTDLKKYFESFNNNLEIQNHGLHIIETKKEYQIIISSDKKNITNNISNIKIYNFNDDNVILENNIILEKIFKDNNPLELLNNSFFIAPIILEINSYLDKKIIIKYELSEENILLMPNIIFKIAPNIKADIINIFPENKFNSIINDNINIFIEKNSKINYNIIQTLNKNIIINNSKIYLKRNSSVNINTISNNSSLIRNNLTVILEGENSEAFLNGLYFLENKNHIDNNINIKHLKPNTYSNQLYKGIISEDSIGIFNGKIYVHKNAQKTNAFQLNKILITSEKGVAKTKPQLEIFADDVKCSHGATIGQIDQNQLFYLKSRGIKENIAKQMIIKAFIYEIIDKMNNKFLDDYINFY